MTDQQTTHSGPTPTGNPKADAKAAKAYAKASRNWYQKKRWWAAGALALIIIGGGMSDSGETTDDQKPVASDANVQSEPSEQPAEETAAEPVAEEEEKAEEPAPAPEPKAMKVEATQIVKEFEQNELAADAKYEGKDLLITGRISKIDTDMWNEDEYVLRLGGKWDFLTVNCYGMSTDELATLKTGDDVTVVGTFDDGGDLGVEVKDCSLA